MPRYDFRCKSCDKKFELDLKISEKDDTSPNRVCPQCSSQELEQLLTFQGGISVKSSGPPSASCATGKCPFA